VLHSKTCGIGLLVICLPLLAKGWIIAAVTLFGIGVLVLTGWSPNDFWWNGRTDPWVERKRERERHERQVTEERDAE
jgi:hypothetical protein